MTGRLTSGAPEAAGLPGADGVDCSPTVAHSPRFRDLVPAEARLVRLMSGATWAEGPVWLPDEASVVWSDVPGDRLMRWSQSGGSGVIETDVRFQNGHALDRDGLLIACEQGGRRISRREVSGEWVTVADRVGDRRFNSPNDVAVKSDGSIWFSDPPYGIVSDWEGHRADSELDGNYVFRHDPASRRVEIVTMALEEPNGLAFSPDESVLYVSDTSAVLRRDGTGNHHIVAFDVVAGRRLADPRIFAVIEPGVPDGFAVDVHGNVFTSAGDGIHVLSVGGEHLGTIPVPERSGNCTFGGPLGTTLFVTATTSLYAIELAVPGALSAGR